MIQLGYFALAFFACALFFSTQTPSLAATGTIDTTDKFAWGENIGWINFGCDNCAVQITDSEMTGNAWASQFGWINLNPTNGGVENDGTGTLSGFAWGANIGWIDFDGV